MTRLLKPLLITALLAVVALAAYLTLWPVPITPVAWQAPVAPGYLGPHAPNARLANLQTIELAGEVGPEHVALGRDGQLYAAVASGAIVKMAPDGSQQAVFARTGGRVLGFDFDAAGQLVAADAMKGLLRIAANGQVEVLADQVAADDPIRYANSVVVAPSGLVYFTDASGRFAPREWGGTFEASVLDILEQASTGRVLVYDPASRQVQVVARGLSFANGIALSSDGQALFVNETGRYRLWKIDSRARDVDVASLAAPAAGGADSSAKVLLDNLPGYPDNLMRGLEGRIWVGLAKPRNPVIDQMADKPWLRAMTLRLPRAWWPIPKAYGHVFAIDEQGRVLEDLQDPSGAYPETTSVVETADRLYIQSLHAHSLGWLPRR